MPSIRYSAYSPEIKKLLLSPLPKIALPISKMYQLTTEPALPRE
jgi:hypothetical protein